MRTPEEIAKMLARIAINSRDFAIILTAWRDECIAEATRVLKVVSGEQVAALAERYEAERAAYKEIAEYEALLSMQHTRSLEADELWRRAHPGKAGVTPDLGKLLEWLMGFVPEAYKRSGGTRSEEAPMCTRPDMVECHAKVHTGGRCMSAFQCPPERQDEGQGGGN
jgi:hypothetical protein